MNEFQKNIIRIAVALIIVVIALWWTLSNIDLAQLGEIFLSAKYSIALLSVPLVLFSHLLRAWRWQTLLNPTQQHSSILNLFSAVMVGYAANNIIPRSGEFLRPFVYGKRSGLSLTTAIASVVVERFIDVLNLLVFMLVALYFAGDQLQQIFPGYSLQIITRSVALSGIALLALMLLTAMTTFGEIILEFLFKPFRRSLYEKIHKGLISFKDGLKIIRTPSQYFRIAVQSGLIWLFYILPVYVMFFAFDFHGAHVLGFFDACVVLLVMAIATTIAPTPGAIGVLHVFVTAAMTQLYGISKEQALAYITLSHALNFIPVLIVGGLFMLREQVQPNLKKVPARSDAE